VKIPVMVLQYLGHKKTKHLFTRNVEVHNHGTGTAKNIHLPITNLTIYKKCEYYTKIKILNYPLSHIKNVANRIQDFKKSLSDFFLTNILFYL